ncbi:MAG TPA: MFS transporter [Streptosporangiaceae bacterium]
MEGQRQGAQQAPGGKALSKAARLGPVFAVVAAGVAMSNLDTFVVNVALPQIDAHFHTQLSSVSWILNAYTVIFAALLVPAGSLADRLGARPTFLLGTGIFTAASLACSMAPGIWWLVAFRAVQAAGAAALIPSSLGLLLAAAPPEKRQIAVRGWTAISGVAAALGPALGGLLTEASWRWVFWINVPIGVAALLAGVFVLPVPPARNRAARPDLAGAILLTLGAAAAALGLVESSTWGWGSARVIGALVAGAVLLCLFVAQSARHPDPVLPLGLLKMSSFSWPSAASLLFAIPFAAMLLSIVLWCQDVWHWSPLVTGLGIAPGPLMVPIFALGAGPVLVRRFGSSAVGLAGSLFFAAGIGWWIAGMRASPDYPLGMLPGMLLGGIGVGLALPTLISVALTALPPPSFSTGSAVITMGRQIGTVLGVGVLVAILGASRHAGQVAAFDRGWWFIVAASVVTALACLPVGRAAARPSTAPASTQAAARS